MATKDRALEFQLDKRLQEGRPMDGWTPPVFAADPPPAFEDVPWAAGCFLLVSSRLRAFLEAEAPGAAQYLPVVIEGPGAEGAGPYFAVNWLRTLPCLDEAASMNVDPTGRRYVEVPVIDPRRAPADAVIGPLGGYTVVTLVRDDLRKKLKAAGFTGPQFYKIAHSTDGHEGGLGGTGWGGVSVRGADGREAAIQITTQGGRQLTVRMRNGRPRF
jgi:hypothetical protein